MQDQIDQYHHYIPRFLLRNFAIDKYERIFESNIKQQKKKGQKNKQQKKKKVEVELLQNYNRKENRLGVSFIRRTYGIKNMYKDLNHEDVMHVEEKLSKLERQASKAVQDIIKASKVESQVVLLRKDLEDLRKFLFIMNYRNGSRLSQFADEKFDLIAQPMIKDFMQQHKLQSAQEVWLQNIREILDTPHEEVKDNLKIFSIDRDDYKQRMVDRFLVIWQAGENDEFIITSNGFGIFEGVNGTIAALPFQFAYHSFYVISPKLVLVLCHFTFRKEIGTDNIFKMFGKRSIFENVPHPPAIPNYVGRADPSSRGLNNEHTGTKPKNMDIYDEMINSFDMHLKIAGIKTQWNDTFTFPFVKITSNTVRLINSMFLNEAREDLVLTFLSRPYLYKTIVKYHRDKDIGVQQDFSGLKKKLFIELNKTHKENLHLRRNITAGHTCSWNVHEMGSGS